MSAPAWAPMEEDTYDLLYLVADPKAPVGRREVCAFLDACQADAARHGGLVSVNRVRARLAAQAVGIDPRRYSSLWARFSRPGRGPLARAVDDFGAPLWESCSGSTSGNDGRPFPIRRWVGFTDASEDPR